MVFSGTQANSELLRLAELSAPLPRRRSGAIEVLLAAARPFDDGFLPLKPLWAQEAVHRAFSTLRLFEAIGAITVACARSGTAANTG